MSKITNEYTFFEHLDELRIRLIKIAVTIVIAAFGVYGFIDRLTDYIVRPVGQLVFTSPADAFMAQITLTFLGAIVIASPIIIFQIWRFIVLGLRTQEVKFVRVFAPISLLLFLAGGLFAYFIIVPISIQFLLSFSSHNLVPMITVKSYISFVGMMVLAFSVVFELPLILMFLTKIGIATPAFLIQKRRHAIILILIVSALITPPDVVSQLMLAIPLVGLYEIGIVASRIVYRNKKIGSC
ncbi:MAG: twin-arginine translocase subunit TatC [Candidatus Omnitrophica bacterium]|nr:twin-arginine translocase subunit TatC [Candidatus Omnitrophota bacterium]MCB9747326.1 twin-arginine translocase subunit TatC [Candidatus Omnitrophota bacterium]